MRFVHGFLGVVLLAVMLEPSSLLAEPRTVRGCVEETTPQGVWLRVGQRIEGEPATNRFLLLADDDLLEEISRREGQEVQVTGLVNPEFSSPAIVEPPVFPPPGAGNFPRAGGPPGVTSRVTTRVSVPGTGRPRGPFAVGVPIDRILVEEYRATRPACLRYGPPPRLPERPGRF